MPLHFFGRLRRLQLLQVAVGVTLGVRCDVPLLDVKGNKLTTSKTASASPWTQTFQPHHLPDDVKCRYVKLTSSGALTAATKRALRDLDVACTHAVLKKDMHGQLL